MAALKLRRVVAGISQRWYETPHGICGGQQIQVFSRVLLFSLVSMTATSTDPLRSRKTGQLKTIVPIYIMLPNHKRIEILKKVLELCQSGAYQQGSPNTRYDNNPLE
jgi:hypothetical protein